ncbi:MAG: metallophosphoesterase, partial [Bacteroidales bacterium]|nr:metallophosphoesterase [Candidatus Cacconaster scatequi]
MTKLKITSAALLLFTVAVSAQTFSSPLTSEKKPWTAIPQGNSDTYKFVVLPDKTGGSETGAFEKALEEINRIAPDFVINVGDLVEGFVSDVKFSEPQWADMKQRLSKLEVPFFLVGGNHDLSSQAQTEDY